MLLWSMPMRLAIVAFDSPASACRPRRATAPGAVLDAAALRRVGRTQDQQRQDAVLEDALRRFVDLRFRESGARIDRIFGQPIQWHAPRRP
jgi:hypothetical protein